MLVRIEGTELEENAVLNCLSVVNSPVHIVYHGVTRITLINSKKSENSI